jgi:hypothetical protein
MQCIQYVRNDYWKKNEFFSPEVTNGRIILKRISGNWMGK